MVVGYQKVCILDRARIETSPKIAIIIDNNNYLSLEWRRLLGVHEHYMEATLGNKDEFKTAITGYYRSTRLCVWCHARISRARHSKPHICRHYTDYGSIIMKKLCLLGAVCASLLSIVVTPALASVIYSYEGTSFNSFSPAASYSSSDRVTGTVELEKTCYRRILHPRLRS